MFRKYLHCKKLAIIFEKNDVSNAGFLAVTIETDCAKLEKARNIGNSYQNEADF